MPADDGGIGTDGGALAHAGFLELVLAFHFGARRIDVSEHAGRPAEYTALQDHAFVQAHVILNLAVIADNDVWPRHDVLADHHIAADLRARQDMAEMPDLGAL